MDWQDGDYETQFLVNEIDSLQMKLQGSGFPMSLSYSPEDKFILERVHWYSYRGSQPLFFQAYIVDGKTLHSTQLIS